MTRTSSGAMPISARHDDPVLDVLARELFSLFPLCRRCNRRITRFDDAEVLLLANRLVHRGPCPGTIEPMADR